MRADGRRRHVAVDYMVATAQDQISVLAFLAYPSTPALPLPLISHRACALTIRSFQWEHHLLTPMQLNALEARAR